MATHPAAAGQGPPAFLQRLLRGGDRQWPVGLKYEPFLELMEHHGVHLLIYEECCQDPAWQSWPAPLRDRLRRHSHHAVAADWMRQRETRKLLSALTNANIPVLILKGAALAHQLYENPALRVRCDTDLLVQPEDRRRTANLLRSLGFSQRGELDVELISYQCMFEMQDEAGIDHTVDLHWQVNNFQHFARVLSFEELDGRAVAVPELGPHARTLDPVHAMLLACMHRTGHQHGTQTRDERLLWLVDIHRMAQRLSPAQWDALGKLCRENDLSAVVLEALENAVKRLQTSLPRGVIDRLAAEAASQTNPAGIKRGTRLRWTLAEFRALPGWTSRLRLLKEYVFPPARYMMKKYRLKSRALLPLYYGVRVVQGIRKRM